MGEMVPAIKPGINCNKQKRNSTASTELQPQASRGKPLPKSAPRNQFGEDKTGSNVLSKWTPKVPPRSRLKENERDNESVTEDNRPKESDQEILNKFKDMTSVSKLKENVKDDNLEESDEEILKELSDMTKVSNKKNYLMVAAIDFGSSYSGCAFSFKTDFERNPLDIYAYRIQESSYDSLKVPTVLLLNPDKSFKAFGSEAEEKYAEILESEYENENDYYYFSRFKMQLYNKEDLNSSMLIPDISGKEDITAIDVFAICIEYIRDVVFRRAAGHVVNLQDSDVHWVLTVPAIWNEGARQFMIDAAEHAGIDPVNLTLALEPEAAALFCKRLEIKKQDQGQFASLRSFKTGSIFLVVDLGGGTVDITSNEVLEKEQLKEIHPATGGPWGGDAINTEFWKLLCEIFGCKDVERRFIKYHREDYLEMTKSIELKKRNVTTHDKIVLQIPPSLRVLIEKSNPEIISEKYKDTVKFRNEKIIIAREVVYDIFKPYVDEICNQIRDLLDKSETAGVSTILLVGGYASCDLLQNAVKERFKNLTVICPLDPDLVVLKGAVIMGHMDTPIVERVAKCHYGIAIGHEQKALDRTFMPLTGMQEFIPFLRKGQPIKVNEVVSEFVVPIAFDQLEAYIRIYTSNDTEPPTVISYTHCKKVGNFKVNLPRFRRETILKIVISTNKTEFKVVATDEHTGRCFSGMCRFLTREDEG